MKKPYIILLLVVLVVGVLLFANRDNDDIVNVVEPAVETVTLTLEDDVADLEAELASLEAEIASGGLTEDAATEAKIKIISKLTAIESVGQSTIEGMTANQQTEIQAGLERMKQILLKYQSTLETVENMADDAAVEEGVVAEGRKMGRTWPGGKMYHLTSSVSETIESIEEFADDVEEYIETGELPAEEEMVDDEEVTGEEEMVDETEPAGEEETGGETMTEEVVEEEVTQ